MQIWRIWEAWHTMTGTDQQQRFAHDGLQMRRKHNTWLLALILACVTGCSEKPVQTQPEASTRPDTPPQATPQQEETPAATSDAPPQPACTGGTEADENCLCGNVTLARADSEGWACADNFWRCVHNGGCQNQGRHYPAGVDLTENGIQCGLRGDIPEREGFKCAIQESAWVCVQDTCTCHGKTIARDKRCLSNTCQGIVIDQNDGLTCTPPGWKINWEDRDITLSGRNYQLSWPIIIGQNVLKCDTWEIAWADADKYKCEEIEIECEFEEWKLSYHWTCTYEKGCACGDTKCKNGEQCNLGKCVRYAKTCEKGNCPCGDGFCMKDGVCVDGHCICGEPSSHMTNMEVTSNGETKINQNNRYWKDFDNKSNGGRINRLFVSNRFGEFTCSEETSGGSCYDTDHFVTCENENGCHTTDGRHYVYGDGTPGFYNHDEHFHVDAGFDLVVSSPSDGTCVLDRQDDLKPMHEVGKKADVFICDEPQCRCGKQKCHLGQICRKGICEFDTCQVKDAYLEKIYVQDDPDCEGADPGTDQEAGTAAHSPQGDTPETHAPGTDHDDFAQVEHVCPGEWTRIYDTKKCKGGTRYCRGVKDKVSMPAPQEPEGYSCESMDNHDDAHKAWKCRKTNCKCGGEFCPEFATCIAETCLFDGKPVPAEAKHEGCSISKKYGVSCETASFANGLPCCGERPPGEGFVCEMPHYNESGRWICDDPNGCLCHGRFTPQHASCEQGRLLCHGLEFRDGDSRQYACEPIYSNWRRSWTCTAPEGCTCGSRRCNDTEICVNGACTCKGLLKPEGHFECARGYSEIYWKCKDPDGCTCPFDGTHIEENDTCDPPSLEQFKHLEIKNDAYVCGKTPMPDLRNFFCNENHEIACDQTLCSCNTGDSAPSCPKFALCDGGKCLHPKTHQPITQDEHGYFHEGIIQMCLAKNCPCKTAKEDCKTGEFCTANGCETLELNYDKGHYFAGYVEIDEDAYEDTYKDWKHHWKTLLPAWDKIYASYYFQLWIFMRPECTDLFGNYEYSAICALPQGCPCGTEICPYGETCKDNRCNTSDDFDKQGNALCHFTRLAPPIYDFQCGALGWTCNGPTCPCGDAQCRPSELCLKPGLCVPVKALPSP